MISFTEALNIIKQSIQDIHYPEQPANLYSPISYLLDLKGKKVRPALTLLAYNLYKEDTTEALNMALAWEIFHNFTLMHDDVMDKADLRRGKPTVHKKWNENTAILSGDAMLILAYQYLLKINKENINPLLALFSTTAMEICEGQQYDMEFESRMDVTEEEYLNMIRLKTAVMIGGSLQSGAMIADADAEDYLALYEFGINLGLAFQIQDDILDVYGDPSVFGKNIGGDILCGKKTYLLVSALNQADDNTHRQLIEWLDKNDDATKKIEAVTAIYNKLSIKEKAYSKKEYFYNRALQALHTIKVKDERKIVLRQLAADLMERKS